MSDMSKRNQHATHVMHQQTQHQQQQTQSQQQNPERYNLLSSSIDERTPRPNVSTVPKPLSVDTLNIIYEFYFIFVIKFLILHISTKRK